MIQLHNINLAFGGQQILNNLTWTIKLDKRIGLIGPNGAGKSTLLRIVSGVQPVDDGTIMKGQTTIGYLEQDVQEGESDGTVLEEAMKAFQEIHALEAEEHRLTEALAAEDHESPSYDKLLHALDQVHTKLATMEAHRIQDQTETVLMGLGFSAKDVHRPLRTFSGGWRMRVALARLLLRRPEVLLLDEPTNHLDIDSIGWLETYLKNYPGTVIIVSHDRYFLDRMVTTTAELSRGKVTEYAGNYTYYLEAREENRIMQRASYENQQRQIAETERFIERFRYKASKARQVQSRVKMLEKMERLLPPEEDAMGIGFRFPEPSPSGKVVLSMSPFKKAYPSMNGPIEVFTDAGPLTIERGDKIALIGANGAGKSTLARMLRGNEMFDGSRSLGHNVSITFFAQHQADVLNPNNDILDSLREQSRGHSETELRSLAGAFLFTGDDVFKPVSVLSGGERSRVALACTLLHPANFLILDEPTNHLDIQSINVLIEALKQYNGAFVVVSHDRHFLDQIANKVWRVERGEVRSYLGNYSEYLWQIEHGTASRYERKQTSLQPNGKAKTETKPASEKRRSGPKTKEQKRREAEERRRRKEAMKEAGHKEVNELSASQIRHLIDRIEALILEKETTQTEHETTLADPDLYSNPDRAQAATSAYDAVKAELADLYKQWEALSEQLEQAS